MTLLLYIPVLTVCIVLYKKNLTEFKEINEAYHLEILDTYIDFFDKLVIEAQEWAAYISKESRDSNSMLFHGVERLGDDYYRQYLITQELKAMKEYIDASDWGIYLYDIDKCIKYDTTLTIEDIVEDVERQNKSADELRNFFSVDNYEWAKVCLGTTYSSENNLGDLFVGVYTYIGVNKDKAIVWFEFSSQYMDEAMHIVDKNNMGFSLYDEVSQKVLLKWGGYTDAKTEEIYIKGTDVSDCSIQAYMSEDALQKDIYDYASNIGKLISVGSIVLSFLYCGAIYISYKPIKKMTNNIDYGREGEIAAVMNMMSVNRTIIAEQDVVITNLLFSHLLYGGKIPEKHIKRLGIHENTKYYCAYLLSDYLLAPNEAKEIASYVMNQQESRLFVIDRAEENRSIFVVFSENEDFSGVNKYIRDWMERNQISMDSLHVGKVVDQMDDIKESFDSCLAKAKRKQKTQGAKRKETIADILSYLELNFCNPNLSQGEVAEVFQISTGALSRMFKLKLGMGFAEYLTEKRIEYAKELLVSSDCSVGEVALMAGFSSNRYFSKVFKEVTGVTPSSLREQ